MDLGRASAVRRRVGHVMNGDLETKLQRAVALHGSGKPEPAAVLYAEILRADPNHPDALHLLGVTETQLGRPQAGLNWIEKSLAINPKQPAAIANEGNALLALGRPAAALVSYERALALWPDYALALYGRGNACSVLGKPAEALASFDRTLALAPNFMQAWVARGTVLCKLGRHADALAAYDRALELSPRLATAFIGKASAQLGLKAYADAKRSIDRALELAPNSAEAFVERGHLLSELRDSDAAVAAYDRALQLNPDLAVAWFSRGVALSVQARFAEAAASLRRVLQIDPGHAYAQGACLHAELQVCDWSAHAARTQSIAAAADNDQPVDFPFSFLAVCDSPPLQLHCARRFARLQRSGAPLSRATAPRGRKRIRIAYISGDFLEHPTSFLMAGLFEGHDKQQFEIFGIALRVDEKSPTARRVRAAFEHFIEAGDRRDDDLAQLIHELDIDIAVDLMGYTGEHRTGIFTYRPAPIQVNYLGFPATMGTSHIDYLIADEYLIPECHRESYSESIAYLPECFQVNDDRRPVAAQMPTRSQMGLPDSGLVWCSFHSSYKLNPPLFDIWARLLLATPGSVLWLVGGNPAVERNLGREALARGVEPQRLVFAGSFPYPEHLARLQLADICLDTVPFNGGATTSDALWAGVPVVTCSGKSFAARMSGSLLHAVHLPELVTQSLSEYEQLALQLARTPDRLAEVRARLAQNRSRTPLFDTDRFRRHLEAAYVSMVGRERRGLPPATFRVPALPA